MYHTFMDYIIHKNTTYKTKNKYNNGNNISRN